MKHTRKPLLIAAYTLAILLTVAIMLPILAGAQTTSYLVGANSSKPTVFDFDSLDIGTTSSALKTYLNGSATAPSTAQIVADPVNPNNKVVQITSGVGVNKSATNEKYFVVSGGQTYDITWTDATTGKCTLGTVQKVDDTHVSINGAGSYLFSNSSAVQEAVTGHVNGSYTYNVDRNLTVGHSALNETTVVMQVSYYIPKDARGTFESQVMKYAHSGADSADWLNLYQVNMTAGTINTQCFGNAAINHTFPKDTWNTVSLVVNLVNGSLNFYINNVLVQSGYLAVGATQLNDLTFNASQWQVAKLNKSTTGDLEVYNGEFYLDNILCHSYDSSMETTVTAESDKQALYLGVTNINGGVAKAASNSTVLLNGDSVKTAMKYLETDMSGLIAPVPGASIRLSDMTGIRFGTQISTSKLQALLALEQNGDIADVEIGTIVSPRDIVKEAGAFTVKALTTDAMLEKYPATYIEIPATIGKYYSLKGVTLDAGYDKSFVGSIVDIHPGNLNREFSAIGYVKLTLLSGEELYTYSYDYDATTIDNYSRSIAGVADTIYKDKDNYFAKYPDLADHEALILSLSAGANTKLDELNSTIVSNAEYSHNALFFQNEAGISNRLTYDGNNGWRLQSANVPAGYGMYNYFNNMGAAQSLAVYMGEAYTTPMKALTVAQVGNDLKITADGTDTYVLISLTGSFNIRFMKGDGKVMNNVSSIVWNETEKKIAISGNLNDGEAIYGGGERFDAANKRGKLLDLYTFDAYNGGLQKEGENKGEYTGTYTVIPLFTSSRGSGFYVNRYEPMVADFGKASANQWTVTLDNDLSDIYFYATGNITDPIKGYTDLSGHASLPSEWAQGVLICRYGPDFRELDVASIKYENLTDIPNYTTYFTDSDCTVAVTSETTIAEGAYLWKNGEEQYTYRKDENGNLAYYRTTKKGNPAGYGVKQIVENLKNAGMTPSAVILEAFDYGNITNGTPSAIANRQELIDIVSYLKNENSDIKVMLYMGIAGLNNNMLGCKPEYYLRANITNADGTIDKNTVHIPKADTVNPDAIGSKSQIYLDITNPEAVEWHVNSVWGDLLTLGIDGVKIDFCETMPNEGKFNNNVEIDYLWYDDSIFEGKDIHHAYPSYYISMFYKRMNELKAANQLPEDFTVLSRGGGIGSQRNPYMWAGDQVRCEDVLHTQLRVVLNSGLSGIPFMSYDMAGYAYNAGSGGYYKDSLLGNNETEVMESESKIFARAIQYTVFGNMIQTHGDVRNVYELTADLDGNGLTAKDIAVTYTELQKDLQAYVRKLSQEACDTGVPMIRHMALVYQNDAKVYGLDDQFMLGDALLVAPILKINDDTSTTEYDETTARKIYLPEGEWIDLLTGDKKTVGAGGEEILVENIAMDQIPVYLNVHSADAAGLVSVFNGKAWQSINGGKMININDVIPPDDPYGDDFFGKLS